MARVVLLHVCPSLHPLQTLLCAAFCAPQAVVSGLLPGARDQRMLVPVGALRRMLLAIACLGHVQQRPGSDLPQLRAGVLHRLPSPGLPAVEVFEVTSHLVWTHQTTDDPRQLLGPRSPLSVSHAYTLLNRSRRTACRQAHRRFVVQVQPLRSRWTRLSPPSSTAFLCFEWGQVKREGALASQLHRGAGAAPHHRGRVAMDMNDVADLAVT
jgi:hypothetical protein